MKAKQLLPLGMGLFILLFLVGNYCPIERIFGIPCPGCNMFTALYWLFIKWDLSAALFFHPAVLCLVVYGVINLALYLRYRQQMINKKCFQIGSILFLCIFIGVYMQRMVTIFPDYPMQYNAESLLMKIIHLF